MGDIESALQGASHYLSEAQQGTYLTDILMLALTKSTWDNDPDFPPEDWKYEVDNNDTRQGYWDWVEGKRE